MAKKPVTDAEKWLQRIVRARKVRDEWKANFRVPLAYEYLEGRQRPPHVPEREWITINMIYSNLKAILPTLYNRDPYFYVKLKRSYKPDPMLIALYEAKALIRSSMLNYLKAELRLKDRIRLGVMDAMFGYGVMKAHVEADVTENPDAGAQAIDDNGMPLLDDYGAAVIEPELISANERYHWTRVHPEDFLVDEDAGPLDEDVSWYAQRIKRRIEDVREDVRYIPSARKNVQATEISEQDDRDRRSRQKGMALKDQKDPDAQWVITWEIYDVRHEEWLTVAEGCKDYLIKPADLPQGIEQHPFAFLRFFLRDSSWYPLPPVSQWLDSQREYCEARSKFLVHRKRFNRKYEYEKAMVDEIELTKLENGEDGTCIGSNSTGYSAIRPIADAPLDANHVNEIMMIRRDFDDVAIGPNQRGATQGVDSATEAGILEKRALIQEGDDIARVVDFASDAARKMDQQVQVHLTRDEALLVEGPTGEQAWQLIKAQAYSEIEGEYTYEVAMGATTPQLPEIQRAQFTSLMQLFMMAPALGTDPAIVRFMGQLYEVDEFTLEGIKNVCTKMVQGALPMPTTMGSAPGSPPQPGAGMTGAGGMMNIRGGQQ